MKCRSVRAGRWACSRVTTHEPYIVAAHITGKVSSDDDLYLHGKEMKDKAGPDAKPGAGEKKEGDAKAKEADDLAGKEAEQTDINVVLVADIDWIAPIIFFIREKGQSEDMLIDWKFQNVTFVLNVLDELAGDDRFVSIRKRTRPHRILTRIEEATEEQRKSSLDEQTKFMTERAGANRRGPAGIP